MTDSAYRRAMVTAFSVPAGLFLGPAFAFFALPASVIGALLFIGGCERGRAIP